MKRILILVSISLFLCLTASAFQGGGGESTKTGSSKKAVTKKKTSASTSANIKPATISLSNGTLSAILEPSWNYYLREKIFLGPTYFGNSTSFGKHGDSLYALALISDYPTYRALATKGLIKLEELSLSEAPTILHRGTKAEYAPQIKRAATVTLTPAGAKLGNVDNKANTVTFVLGVYHIEKILSNSPVDTNEGDYRLIQGTHVLDIAQGFGDVWTEIGWPMYRERRFRVLFKYDTTESKWKVANASNGRFTAEDRGPRNGDFESANVPPTLDQLRLKRR